MVSVTNSLCCSGHISLGLHLLTLRNTAIHRSEGAKVIAREHQKTLNKSHSICDLNINTPQISKH